MFIHPYDDALVIAGQGTVALEMLEEQPALDALVVPVGGGGLIAGWPPRRKRCSRMTVIGVESRSVDAPAPGRLPVAVGGDTIAEGMAVRDVGELRAAFVRRSSMRCCW